MSEDNLELARRAYDFFNQRDLEAFLAITDPEVVIESRLVAMEGGYRGRDGARRWWNDFLGTLPDYAVEVEELRDLGDVTLGRIVARGHGAASATPLVEVFWHPIEWRDGRCIWWRNCATESEALEAIRSRRARSRARRV
jgi:ketosteroid isomerase-like protein